MKNYYSIWTCRVSADPADDYGNEECILGGEFTIEELKQNIRQALAITPSDHAFWLWNETTDKIVPRSVWE